MENARLPGAAALTGDTRVAIGVRGRGAAINPGNRFETVRLHVCGEALDAAAEAHPDGVQLTTTIHADATRRIINAVDPRVSPEIGFRWTINPYRGCEHGCVYCYARPSHELLGFSSGLDFETQIVAKHDAPALLRRELSDPRWRPATIMLSGVTDPWQPLERKLRLTRGVLEVLSACRHPVSMISKNRLIVRDIDLIAPLARIGAARAAISITTLDERLARAMEPRASRPADRLRAVAELSAAGIDVVVMVAPVIPGLTDRELPAILEAARNAGAKGAGWVMLRLPFQLKEIFLAFLRQHYPQRAAHVESLIRDTREGALYDSRPGVRMRGEGPVAEQIGAMFRAFARRYGLDAELPPLRCDHFVAPTIDGQLSLFAREEESAAPAPPAH